MELFTVLQNLDLLAVGIAAAATGVLGFTVYFNQRESITNDSFLGFTLITIVWGITNYLAYNVSSPEHSLQLFRLTIFWGVWHAFFLFQLLYVFPKEKVEINKKYRLILIPLVVFTSIITLTPYTFTEYAELDATGHIAEITNGPGIALFTVIVLGLIISAIFIFIRTTLRAEGIERRQFRAILTGFIITFALLMIFNFIMPAFFGNARFIPLGPVFIFPFVVATSYAILRHGLLNIKVVATEIFTFILAIVTLSEIIIAKDVAILVFRSSIFILVLAFGILLIRSVRREIETREEIQKLAKELGLANEELKKLDQAKSDFINIASHQLRTPLSIIKGYISMIDEGTFGALPKKLKDPLNKVYISNERLINLVADLLDLSRIERKKMQYAFEPMQVEDVAHSLAIDFKQVAKQKKLALEWKKPKTLSPIYGDPQKLRQVFLNIIDNAVKYTLKGYIHINLEQDKNSIVFSVKDTGNGMTKEETRGLFKKFVRGEDASKERVDGMGLGMYIAKLIISDHHGEIWAESPGKGKGSTFFVRLPVMQATPTSKTPAEEFIRGI